MCQAGDMRPESFRWGCQEVGGLGGRFRGLLGPLLGLPGRGHDGDGIWRFNIGEPLCTEKQSWGNYGSPPQHCRPEVADPTLESPKRPLKGYVCCWLSASDCQSGHPLRKSPVKCMGFGVSRRQRPIKKVIFMCRWIDLGDFSQP